MSRKRISRRKFVGDVGAGVAFTIVPRHVLGRGYRAPSDKLNVACIGVGGMGRNDVRGMEGENIYALCDVDWKSAEEDRKSTRLNSSHDQISYAVFCLKKKKKKKRKRVLHKIK